jgi:hypothetical protein
MALSIAADSLYELINSIYNVTHKKSVSIDEVKKMLVYDGIVKLPFQNVNFFSVKWESEPISEKIVFITRENKGILKVKSNNLTGIDTNFINQINNFLIGEPHFKINDFEVLTKNIIELTDLYIIDSINHINDPIESYKNFIDIVKKRKIIKENDVLTGEYYCVNNYSGYLYKIIFTYDNYKQLKMISKRLGQVSEKKIEL